MKLLLSTHNSIVFALSATALLAMPAAAREPSKPITHQDVDAVDVAATPAGDLNLRKDEIPPLLAAALVGPYSLHGLGNCRGLSVEIGALDAVLGDDIDVPQADDRRISPGRVAQSVVGSFIPFRGVIRELSGANEHDRQMQTAILAGVARRSFLKGTGQARGCQYPARAAVAKVMLPPRVTRAQPAVTGKEGNADTRQQSSSTATSRP